MYVGEVEERTPLVGGICIDWEDERRKNGIEEGVNRFEWLRRTEEEGLSGPGGGAARVECG